MVAFEVFLIFAFALFIFAGFTAAVKSLVSDRTARLKGQYGDLGGDHEQNLKNRVLALEDEIRELKAQMLVIQESSEFALRMIESKRDKTS
ncbi:hypothetical protein KBI23_17950 [bacterium]|nr:hypothetical protein [bacterium]MBP9810748.1 hypothetical protein [bacterium]